MSFKTWDESPLKQPTFKRFERYISSKTVPFDIINLCQGVAHEVTYQQDMLTVVLRQIAFNDNYFTNLSLSWKISFNVTISVYPSELYKP